MTIYLVIINDFMNNYVEGTVAQGAYRTRESAKEAMRQYILEYSEEKDSLMTTIGLSKNA